MGEKSKNELPRSYRFAPETAALLDALSDATGLDRKEVLTRALHYWVPEGARLAAEKRGQVDKVLAERAGPHAAHVRKLLGASHEVRRPVS